MPQKWGHFLKCKISSMSTPIQIGNMIFSFMWVSQMKRSEILDFFLQTSALLEIVIAEDWWKRIGVLMCQIAKTNQMQDTTSSQSDHTQIQNRVQKKCKWSTKRNSWETEYCQKTPIRWQNHQPWGQHWKGCKKLYFPVVFFGTLSIIGVGVWRGATSILRKLTWPLALLGTTKTFRKYPELLQYIHTKK